MSLRSPKKKRNHGSLASGWLALVLMLTTAGAALRTAPLRLPGAACGAGAGASRIEMVPVLPGTGPPRCSHSGFSVPTTK